MRPLPESVRRQLRFVRTDEGEIDLDLFPNFLVIGPQRTGTTWLTKNLRPHPQVFVSQRKELYYFNTLVRPDKHPAGLPPVSAQLSWYLDFFVPADAFLARRDRETREAFGEPYEIAVRGEGCATYAAALSPQIIADIVALRPEIRVLTMVRDPVDRAWSHAKKDLARGRDRPVEDVTEDEWIEFVSRKYQRNCGHYGEHHARWLSVVPQEQFFVGRYRDVVERPAELLLTVMEFLGIRADERYVTDLATARVNPTAETGPPPAVGELLESMFGAERERLRNIGLI